MDLVRHFPLFPLGLVALPSEVVPLHIFEERYKAMIARCLEEESEFGIVWLADDDLGIARAEVRDLEGRGIKASTQAATMSAKGKVDATRSPPDEGALVSPLACLAVAALTRRAQTGSSSPPPAPRRPCARSG